MSVNEAEEERVIEPEKRAVSILFPFTVAPRLTILLGSRVETASVKSFTPSVPPIAEPSIVIVSPTL